MENELEPGTAADDPARSEVAERPSLRAPVAITMISLLVWFGFQTVALVLERNSLIAVNSNLEAANRQAEKLQAELETLVTKTAEFAGKGNANARIAMEELAKRGFPLASGSAPAK